MSHEFNLQDKTVVVCFLLFLAASVFLFIGIYSFFEGKNDEVVARTAVTRSIKYIDAYIARELENGKSAKEITENLISSYREYEFVQTISHVNHNYIILESKIISSRHINYKILIVMQIEGENITNYMIIEKNITDDTIIILDKGIFNIEIRFSNHETSVIPI